MPKPEGKRDLEALIKATEENRRELRKIWQKVEDLDGAIQASIDLREGIKSTREKNRKPKP